MRMLLRFAAALCLIGAATPALAQGAPTPVPIEEWSQEKVAAQGREIYIQDTAAWVATEALLATLDDAEKATIRGWVVLGEGADRTVRFLKTDGDGVAPGWDVVVTAGRATAPVPAPDTAMIGETLIRYTARQTAVANMGALRCGQYNSVVARDPDSDGWLVWLLASTTEPDVIPMGGHYRFELAADARTVIRRDQLSNTCLNLAANPPPGPQGQVAAVVVSQIVSSGPVETHVFLSLQFGKPIYVIAGQTLFSVEGDRIRQVPQNR